NLAWNLASIQDTAQTLLNKLLDAAERNGPTTHNTILTLLALDAVEGLDSQDPFGRGFPGGRGPGGDPDGDGGWGGGGGDAGGDGGGQGGGGFPMYGAMGNSTGASAVNESAGAWM